MTPAMQTMVVDPPPVSMRAAPKKKGRRTVETMWKEYLRTRAVDVRNELVVHYSQLVYTHAARLSRKLPDQVAYDEICSAAFNGLIDAVEAYDPARKAKFETFCQQRISGAVMDWLREMDPQSRTVRTFERRKQLAEETRHDIDTTAGPDQIASQMGMSSARFDELSRLSQMGKQVQISTLVPRDSSENPGKSTGWDVPDTRASDPAAATTRAWLVEHVTKGLASDERLILVLYYFEELTMAEIGQVLDLSESRVSQIHKSVLQRLRARLTRQKGDMVEKFQE